MKKNIIINDLVHVYSVRTDSTMWASQQRYEEYFNTLNYMNLIEFSEHFRVGCRDHLKNKICLHVKKNFVPMIFPKKNQI